MTFTPTRCWISRQGFAGNGSPRRGRFRFEPLVSYCGQLKVGARLATKKSWRVPTLVELLTLVDEGAAAPMIDRSAFPDTPAAPFWSSSTFANGSELGWYVRFDQGSGLYGRLLEAFRVRCVR